MSRALLEVAAELVNLFRFIKKPEINDPRSWEPRPRPFLDGSGAESRWKMVSAPQHCFVPIFVILYIICCIIFLSYNWKLDIIQNSFTKLVILLIYQFVLYNQSKLRHNFTPKRKKKYWFYGVIYFWVNRQKYDRTIFGLVCM